MTNKVLIIGVVVTILVVLLYLKFKEHDDENYDRQIAVASVPEINILPSLKAIPVIHQNHDEELQYAGLQSGVRNNFGPCSIDESSIIGVNLRCPYETTNPELINAFPHAGKIEFFED